MYLYRFDIITILDKSRYGEGRTNGHNERSGGRLFADDDSALKF